MKKFVIFAPGIDNQAAFSMTFVLFNNFTLGRSFGVVGGEQKKFAVVTIFANASEASKVTDLRDKFTVLGGSVASATEEDIIIL